MGRREGVRTAGAVLPEVHLARDHPRSEVAGLVRAGTWVRVRPGAYVDAAVLDAATDPDRCLALARVAALGMKLRTDAVVSHTSCG